MTPADATRPILWNVDHPFTGPVMYGVLLLACAVAAVGFLRMAERWRIGRAQPTPFLAEGLTNLVRNGLFQRKVTRHQTAGRPHLLVYLGFLMLLLTTTMVMLQHDFGLPTFRGYWYLFLTLGSDLLGAGLLLGIGVLAWRRYIRRPDALASGWGDGAFLAVMALLVVQGFLLEGLRIHAFFDPFAHFSPVGLGVALVLWPLRVSTAMTLHFWLWWLHTFTVFAALALTPYSKLKHLVTSPLNLFLRRANQGSGPYRLPYPGDIATLAETSENFSVGANTIKDRFWTQLVELDACTSCGRCQDVCPAYLSGKVLSPKWLILDQRNHLMSLDAQGKLGPSILPDAVIPAHRDVLRQELSSYGVKAKNGQFEYAVARAANKLLQASPVNLGGSVDDPIAGKVMSPEVFWSCTTCLACVEACPVGIDHVKQIVDTRRHLVMMEGQPPAETQSMLRGLETRGHALADPSVRTTWHADLGVKTLEPGESVEVLYWVGCATTSDPRKQRIARALVTILQRAGVDFAILGERECCTGDPARRIGDELLFQTLAKGNMEVLRSISCRTIVANCPHCVQALGNEYPTLGEEGAAFRPRVIHHSELIAELIGNGSLDLAGESSEQFTFHDPCYLGRYNNGYDAPREVLHRIGGRPPAEMEHHREKSLCCGAGGGHFFFDLKRGERVNTIRTREALATGSSCVATGCPFCLHMLEDGTKLTNSEEKLAVKDIAEIVADRLVSQ